MLFNSIDFAIFLPVVFLLYWFITHKNLKVQNVLLLAASYFFYGWWDWRFLSLIVFSSGIDYIVGRQLGKEENKKKRKQLLLISILMNLGFLGFFKYYNFFAENFAESFKFFGNDFGSLTLDIVLPVGISFYTFQTLSYSIDVYKRKLEPAKDIVSFFAFVSFFPQLVAGPIERASNLLPQFYKTRKFDVVKASDGMRQILFGLFKKVVIADNCAVYVNDIFSTYADQSGSNLVMGAVLFAFQIYGDFSGYSDMAIGTSRLFGFDLKQNFAFPYFSRDIAEFWRRWHISLSTWFRDYVYIPLGGSKGGTSMKLRNTFVIFLVSGFWHGANWTFIIWGLLNAIYFLPLLLSNKNRKNLDDLHKINAVSFLKILWTFAITCLAWIFFRADTVSDAFLYIQNLASASLFTIPTILPLKIVFVIGVMLFFEWINRRNLYGLEIGNWNASLRRLSYALIFGLIFLFGNFSENVFIYFQF